MFSLITLPKMIGIGVLALLFGWTAGYLVGDYRGYHKGYNSALAVVEKQDEKAKEAAHKAVSSVGECYDLGGVWRQSTGKCER